MIHRNHSTLARVARLLPVLAVSVLLSACAAPRAYPPHRATCTRNSRHWVRISSPVP